MSKVRDPEEAKKLNMEIPISNPFQVDAPALRGLARENGTDKGHV